MNATRMRLARALGITATCAILVATATDRAHAADPRPTAATNDADRWFEQGVAAQKANKLAEAEALFQKAWAQKKTWDIAANLGLVELKQGKLVEGAGHVAYAMASLPPTESDTTRGSLTKALDAARLQVVELKVACDVDGATVRVGGKEIGVTPLATPVYATPGTIAIEASKEGYETWSKSFDGQKGTSELMKVAMAKKAAPQPTTSATATAAPVEAPKSTVPAVVAFGAGGLGLIVGAITGGLAAADKADLLNTCKADGECPKSARAKLSEANTLSYVSTTGFVIAGLGAAIGVTWLLLPAKPKNGLSATLQVGPSFVTVKGAF